MTDIPEDIFAGARMLADHAQYISYEQSALNIARAILAERERMEAQANRRTTDLKYMLQAYRNMLGPKGLEVAAMWEAKGVLRVHHDWTGAGFELTGEQRAEEVLAWEAAPRRLVERFDGNTAVEKFDSAIRQPVNTLTRRAGE